MLKFLRVALFVILAYLGIQIALSVLGGVVDAVFGLIVPGALLVGVVYLMLRLAGRIPSRGVR